MSTALPPPTSNTMHPDQRTRLARTARKLEALLGTTPQIVELDNRHGCLARKRTVVYGSPFSSSASSLDSTSSEREHAHVRPVDSHQRAPSWGSPLPNALPTKVEQKIKKSKGPQPVAQPLLLRMSAVPVSAHSRQSSRHLTTPIHVTPAPPLLTPFERRKLKVDSVLGPLSPINKSHFPLRLHSDLGLPPSPSSLRPEPQDALVGLSDKEKRIKMAKVQRMMGENIPAELVFGETTPEFEKTDKTSRRRSRSMSAMKTESLFYPIPEESMETKRKGKEIEVVRPLRPLPTLPICQPSRTLPPIPAPIVTRITTTTISSPHIRQNSSSMQQKGRKSRPRSLTLGTDSAIVAANIRLAKQEKKSLKSGWGSLDEGRHRLALGDERKHQSSEGKNKDAPFTLNQVRQKEKHPNLAFLETEIWKRKEREWSGEWNIKDMDEITKALRSLKAS